MGSLTNNYASSNKRKIFHIKNSIDNGCDVS